VALIRWLITQLVGCVLCADAVLAVAWSPVQADLVATGGLDDKAFIWRVSSSAVPWHSMHPFVQ
jgi:WD40 repeat protein